MRCSRQLYQNLLLHLEFVMASVCKICAGPIEPLDQHLHCVACLGLAHAEAALDESDCGHCADLPVRVLRARRDVVRGLFGVGLTAASVPLVSPPSPGGGSAVLPCRRTQRSPHSPISFPEDCFRPPSNIEGFVAFGHEEGDEAMSISASEKDGWAGSEPEQLGSSEPSGLQEELMRVLSKAVQELELTWNPPEEPVRSKLDSWYFRSTRKADARTSVPFFPDVHEQLVKTWSAPQSARVHSNTQAMFSHVDGAEAHDVTGRQQAAMLLLWADSRLLSIRATHIPGLLNRGADMLSRRRIPQGEWRLHPESVRMIWNLYGEAEVDLFATSENAHCPSFFSLSHSPLEGDALTARWPTARLYAFPPIKILPLVLCKIREERASVILIAPNWPNQPWFPDLTELLIAPPWPIPVRKDMLSQVDGSVWHPNPELWNLHVWLLQGCQGS